ncbi:hypothetical protein ACWGJX_33665 [Streptomyces sp. NPDC054775]
MSLLELRQKENIGLADRGGEVLAHDGLPLIASLPRPEADVPLWPGDARTGYCA